MAHERLAMERRRARLAALTAAVAGPRRAAAWRLALGHALIRLGRAVAGTPVRSPRHA
jgi:hypothetical protein